MSTEEATLTHAPTTIVLLRVLGSIVVVDPRQSYLIGYPKRPGDFREFGFMPPPPIETWQGHFAAIIGVMRCTPRSDDPQSAPFALSTHLDPEACAQALVARLVVARNGSVSERLWRLAQETCASAATNQVINATWLLDVPLPLWEIIRNEVLRCS